MKFFHKIELPRKGMRSVKTSPESHEVKEWCRLILGKSVKGGNWWVNRNHIYFKDEQCYMMYTLRWA